VAKKEVIKRADLVTLLKDSKKRGARFITIVTDTDARLVKTPAHLKEIRKISKINGIINSSYEKSINRILEKIGEKPNFEAEPLPWGTRIDNTCLIQYNGKLYVQVNVQKDLDCAYYDDRTKKKIKLAEIVEYMQKKRPQAVKVRTYMLDNINYIKIDGRLIKIEK